MEIIPNGALGGETQNAELIQMNSAEATVIGADAASGMVPEWALIGAPYLFNSRTSAYAALDGAFGEKLAGAGGALQLYLAGWGDAGFRNVTNSKHEIVKPDDLKGIKIRVMDNELHMALFREFGASPLPSPSTSFSLPAAEDGGRAGEPHHRLHGVRLFMRPRSI